MEVSKKDIRGERMKKIIVQSFLTLINSKNFDSISVIDICNKAEISRATFYAHFQDKYDLLIYTLKYISKEYQAIDGDIQANLYKVMEASNKYQQLFKEIVKINQNSLYYVAKEEMTKMVAESLNLEKSSLTTKLLISTFVAVGNTALELNLQTSDSNEKEEIHTELLKFFNWDYILDYFKTHH